MQQTSVWANGLLVVSVVGSVQKRAVSHSSGRRCAVARSSARRHAVPRSSGRCAVARSFATRQGYVGDASFSKLLAIDQKDGAEAQFLPTGWAFSSSLQLWNWKAQLKWEELQNET